MKPPETKKQYDALVRKQWREMTPDAFRAELATARALKAVGQERGYFKPVTLGVGAK